MTTTLRAAKVTYSNGEEITTSLAAHLTDKEITDYFRIGIYVNLGDGKGGDNMQKITKVEILK